MTPNISVLVTDLDNTLWDWLEIWYASFSAMLDELVDLTPSDVTREALLEEIREVHQRHGTPEYVFLIQELPSLRMHHSPGELPELYAPAIEAYREAREEALGLYRGVRRAFEDLADRGTLLVGYTESLAYQTSYRMRKTGIDQFLDLLYSAPDHDLPEGMTREELRQYPAVHYDLKRTVHRTIPRGETKPNPAVLTDILADVGADPTQTAYVGDNLIKDLRMAQEVGVYDVWAKYGATQNKDAYRLLQQVSHWTDEEISEESSKLNAADIDPTFILHESFDEILSCFTFQPFRQYEKAIDP